MVEAIEKLSDIQSEAGIISTLYFHPDFLLFSEHLKQNYFFDKTNGCLYWAISKLYANSIEHIDSYNLITIIESDPDIKKQIESEMTLSEIDKFFDLGKDVARHTPEEYVFLVKNVIDLAYRRDLYKSLRMCQSYCLSTGITKQDLQKNIYETLDKSSTEFVTFEEIPEYSSLVDNLWNQTVSRQNPEGICGLPSKFPTLNKYLTYEESELVVVAAVRKEGKSMVCMNELYDKLQKGVSCLYIDTEMSDRLFNERLLSHMTRIPIKNIKNGTYDENGKDLLNRANEWLKTKTNFVHLYMPSWTKEELYIIAKKLQRKNNMKFFIFDYFKSREGKDASSVYHELGDAVNFVKNDILGELGISGMAAAQLNRGGDIADSYKIEQYASAILQLKRKKQSEIDNDGKDCGNYKLFVKLNRLGDQMADIDSDYIDLHFRGEVATFTEAKQHENNSPFD